MNSPPPLVEAGQLPQAEHNAMLHLFSAREELLRYGKNHYRPHSTETSTLLVQLLLMVREEPTMSDKLKEFARQSLAELLARLPPEERLKGLTVEERLQGVPPEELRKQLTAEERLQDVTDDELLRILTPERVETLARKRKANGSAKP